MPVLENKNNIIYWLPILLGFFALYVPTYVDLSTSLWATDEQGHGPLILMISMFLIWQKRFELKPIDTSITNNSIGLSILLMGSLFYIFGRTQQVLIFEVSSQILVLLSIFILTIGWVNVRKFWFPLFFLIFMVPLPSDLVDALTLPMKIAVSTVAEYILYHVGYPIARNGVILQIGHYKLLVADACAGLHTVFSLEAMGLLYLHLIKRDSFVRNVTLAILIVPISFVANTIRVVALVLITYYYGDEVGQGFVHDFAGFVLFGVALVLIIFVDTLIHWGEKKYQAYKLRRAI